MKSEQREIKFRAWDESNKIMHHNFQFFSSGNEGNDWIVFASVEEPQIADNKQIILNNPYFREQIKIIQYTGLKDKNGKEIYEGDILTPTAFKNSTSEKWDGYKCEVIFHEGMFCFKPNGVFIQSYKPLYSSLDRGNKANNQFEIIGNIYETELIK